jgi:chromosomal replication initiation ATPase DnaA
MDMTDLIRDLTPTAASLVCAVDDRDIEESHAILLSLTAHELMALAVILAASVDMDKPLGTAAGESESTSATIRRIARTVSDVTGVNVGDIYSTSRYREVTAARQIVCWVATAVGLKSTAIGKSLKRDHSTVLHATERVTATPALLADARRVLERIDEKEAA